MTQVRTSVSFLIFYIARSAMHPYFTHPFFACSEYSRAMKSHFRKFGNQMSGSGNHLCNYASLLA